MADWHLYIIRTATGTLYTGITTDVARRFGEHQAGGLRCARSLRGRGPLQLVFSSPVGDRSRAQSVEWHLKRWPRPRKEKLVRGDLDFKSLLANPDAYRSTTATRRPGVKKL